MGIVFEGKELQQFKDNLARELFGMTTAEAIEAEICIKCRGPAFETTYSEAGRDEYYISGYCEKCFDEDFGEEF